MTDDHESLDGKAPKTEETTDQEPILVRRRSRRSSQSDTVESVDPEIVEVIAGVLETEVERQLVIARRELRAEYHSGPLPSERTIEGYERIVPGSARMIFDTFQSQSAHRMQMESWALKSGTYRSFAGLVAGFIVVMAFLWASYQLIMAGHTVAGTILATVDLVALAGVFVYGSQVLKEERVEKARIMTSQFQRNGAEETALRRLGRKVGAEPDDKGEGDHPI